MTSGYAHLSTCPSLAAPPQPLHAMPRRTIPRHLSCIRALEFDNLSSSAICLWIPKTAQPNTIQVPLHVARTL